MNFFSICSKYLVHLEKFWGNNTLKFWNQRNEEETRKKNVNEIFLIFWEMFPAKIYRNIFN